MSYRLIVHKAAAKAVSERAAIELVTKVVEEIKFEAKVRTLLGPYTTGNLSRSIDSEVRIFTGRVVGKVGSSKHYASAVEGGAVPHMIFPVHAKALKFFWRKVGKTVILSHVSHPGQRGKHYLYEPLLRAARKHNLRITRIGL